MINIEEIRALIKTLKSRKKFILLVSIVFVFLGVSIAFTSPSEWTSSVKFLPEASGESQLGGALGDLANLTGLGGALGSSNGDTWLSPDMYLDILNSGPYYKALFKVEFELSDGNSSSVKKYLEEIHHKSLFGSLKQLPSIVIDKIKNLITSQEMNNPLSPLGFQFFSKKEVDLIKELRERIRLEVSRKTGIVSIRTNFQDRVFAANVGSFTMQYLEDYLNDFANKKDRLNLEYIEKQFLQSKSNFEDSRERLALFKDKNFALTTEKYLLRQEELEMQRDFDYNLYQGLALKYENAKFDVERSTARLSIIEPVTIPATRDSPKKLTIILKAFILGFFLSVLIVSRTFITDFLKRALKVK